MSPHARDRRRDEKRQSALAQHKTDSRRNRQVLAIALILVLVVGGIVGLSYALKKDSTTPVTALVAGCVSQPAVPTDKRSGTLPDKKTAAGKTFIATVATNCGVITMELNGTKAPQTVASFLGLAKSGYWVDSPCHRLTTASDGIFVLQCGDPTGTGSGTPGYGFGVENPPADSIYPAGALAMARSTDPKSNGGQFFVVYKQTMIKDATGYSIFGKITSGMDIVDRVAAAGAAPADANQNTAPLQPISILAVNVIQKKV